MLCICDNHAESAEQRIDNPIWPIGRVWRDAPFSFALLCISDGVQRSIYGSEPQAHRDTLLNFPSYVLFQDVVEVRRNERAPASCEGIHSSGGRDGLDP